MLLLVFVDLFEDKGRGDIIFFLSLLDDLFIELDSICFRPGIQLQKLF